MIFTGSNLALVHSALKHALENIKTECGTCPDVHEFADYLDEIEAEGEQFERLLARIERKHPELADQ